MERREVPEPSGKHAGNLFELRGCKGEYIYPGKGKNLHAYQGSVPKT